MTIAKRKIAPNTRELFVDVGSVQRQKHGERICGDAFCTSRPEPGRDIVVLSDGLGSGVKANILASMTATMALKFVANNRDIRQAAQIINSALPVCQKRKISYATFTIVDANINGMTRVIEMGNPRFALFRSGEEVQIKGQVMDSTQDTSRQIRITEFKTRPNDRLVIFSDGITQAGIGTDEYALGWRRKGCVEYILNVLFRQPMIDSHQLSKRIVGQAITKDPGYKNQDDITCASIFFRKPQRLLLMTGPAFHREEDQEAARLFDEFPGCKIISGGTTANILARELDREITTQLRATNMKVPPCSQMAGADLITEGIITLTKVMENLEENRLTQADPPGKIIEQFLSHDIIEFVVGTRINEAHQDPHLPESLEIRRNIIRRIADLLKKKHLKEVFVRYI